MTMHKKKILNSNPLLFLSMLCIVITIFLTCSVNVNAASDQVAHFPYVLSDEHYRNDYWSAYIEQTITTNSTITNFVGDDPYIIFTNYAYPTASTPHIKVIGFVNPSINGNYDFSTFDYLSNNLNINYSKTFSVDISYNSGGSLSFSYSTSNSSGWNGMFGSQTSGTIAGYTFIHRYPVYVSNEVFTSGSPNFSPIILDHLGTGLDPDAFDPSDALEVTDIIGHNFSNLPTVPSSPFDSSLSVVENIVNAISWLAKIFTALFSNLLNNLVILFNAIITALNNGFTFLSNNLQNFFKDFYDRLLDKIDSIIEGIGDLVGDITSPFDHIREIFNAIYQLGLKNNEFDLPTLIVGLVVPDVDDMMSVLGNYVIGIFIASAHGHIVNMVNFVEGWANSDPVYIFHLPTFTLGGVTFSGLYFDFTWYTTYKPYCDAIITFWLVLNYINFIFRFIPRFLRSAGSGYSEGSDLLSEFNPAPHEDNSWYYEQGYRAPSMFDFM